jgi:hypothetical protein
MQSIDSALLVLKALLLDNMQWVFLPEPLSPSSTRLSIRSQPDKAGRDPPPPAKPVVVSRRGPDTFV